MMATTKRLAMSAGDCRQVVIVANRFLNGETATASNEAFLWFTHVVWKYDQVLMHRLTRWQKFHVLSVVLHNLRVKELKGT
jgi:hypothetical protein